MLKLEIENIKLKNMIVKKSLKSPKIDTEYYRKKHKILINKKILLIITEILIGSASTISSSTTGLINPGVGIMISSSTALLTSIAILITNEFISKLKTRYTKLRDWINVTTLLYEKTLKIYMLMKKLMKRN